MSTVTALVTGSSSGIGAGIARRLHAEGFAVVLNGFQDEAAGQALADELGGDVTYVDADVSTLEGAQHLIAQTLQRFGRLDLLVNNAGIARRIPHPDLDAISDEFWDRIMAVNLRGPWNMAKVARPALVESQGHIINIGSIAGFEAAGSSIPYAVSKAGVLHLTRLLARALGPDIRVNAVAPGYIDTPLSQDWEDQRQHVTGHSPARRLGRPEDVAEAVLGLQRMTYVTGEVLAVDGGLRLL